MKERESNNSNSVLQFERQTDRGAGAFSFRGAQRSAGQLALSGAAKHRAVGMATKEHFPPNSAALHRTKNKRE